MAERQLPAAERRRAPRRRDGGRRGLSIGLAALSSLCLSSCGPGNECQNGQSHCDGHVAWFCSLAGGDDGNERFVWKQGDCGTAACVDDTEGAFCALENAPNPACNGADTTLCVGATITQCRAGYTVATHDCATRVDTGSMSPALNGPTAALCVSGAQGSFCISDSERDPVCRATASDAEVFPACSGNDVVACTYGFAATRASCNDLTCECNGTGAACTLASCVTK